MLKSQLPQITSPAWSARTKRTVAIICLFLIMLALWRLSDALLSVIVAMVLAYLLFPVTNFLNGEIKIGGASWRVPRALAVVLTFIFVVLVILLFILVIVPALVQQFAAFASSVPEQLANVEADLERSLSAPLTFNGQPIIVNGQPFVPLDQLRTALGTDDVFQPEDIDLMSVGQTFFSSLSGLTRPAFSFLGGAFNAVINSIFFLTMLFYLLKDGGIFAHKMVEVTPSGYRNDTRRMLYELSQVWNAYLRGQLILCVFIGVFVFLVATVLGLPNPLVLGLISGVLEFVPTLGPALALVPAVLLALFSQSTTFPGLEGASFAIVVAIVWIVIQNIEAVVVVPRVMGDNLNLHPFVILLAVLAGASLGGALGVILAAPSVATIRLIGQYIYGKLSDQNPFPAVVAEGSGQKPTGFIQRIRGLFSRPSIPVAPDTGVADAGEKSAAH